MSDLLSINPSTGKTIKTYTAATEKEVNTLIEEVHASYAGWRTLSFEQRAQYLNNVAQQLNAHKERYGRIISEEMGKVLKEAVTEVEKCASCATYFAKNGSQFLADEMIGSEYHKSFVTYQPLGIVFGVMPWNFPFWQVFRFALPALMAGNVALLKHASNTSGCALEIESVFKDAELPANIFRSVLLPSKRIESVIKHPHVRAVTLTGSTPAGSSVASLAGKYLKKTVLELGGSDAYLVLEDANIEHAVKTLIASRSLNCGQSCISAKRLIVVEKQRKAFEEGMQKGFGGLRSGDPFDPANEIGPMARADLRDELHRQVKESVEKGARLLAGGTLPKGEGAFYPPTVLTDVKKGMPAYDEELFGPVAVIIPVRDEEEAIAVANDSHFGLGGGVFTQDLLRGEQIARTHMESGSCFVNTMVRSDPRFPFGGIKDSGYGRELSHFGIREFVNVKTVVVVKL